MADQKSPKAPDALSETALNRGIEMLYFGYRNFVAEADAVLAPLDFGRAHHRVIHFVGRNPGMTVAELLATLQITKQSLSRVLGQLVRTGYIAQATGSKDRRQRLLSLTDKGLELERRLSGLQRALVASAYEAAGPDAVAGFEKIMLGLMASGDVPRFED
ncbi:MAG: MarR family transcriptional regulator [Alphaproteobacteria bacterium]|nr:MarR family transcriptional regulator [Alphaproteobacteria bacterium]